MRTRQKCVATDTWRSLGCRTTPLEHWSRRKPTVEPRWARSSSFDWFNAYFEVDLKLVQDANAEYLATSRIAMINDAASLIADVQVKQTGKTVYDSNNFYRVTNIKNLLTMSQDYANSSATSEYFYLDTGDTTIKDGGDANCNKGFTIRSALVLAGKIQNSIIPLNKFSFFFFEGFERNLLPPSQI